MALSGGDRMDNRWRERRASPEQSDVTQLTLIKKAKDSDNRIAVFCIVHNEEYILPHFFQHYDALGVSEYVFFDDRSTDRTLDILSARNDVTIYQADTSFGDVIGVARNGIPIRFCTALRSNFFDLMGARFQWAVIVDADEFLYLPGPFATFKAMCLHLEERRQPYLTAPMVDFYPARLELCSSSRDLDPLASSPYFDRGPFYEWNGTQVPRQFERGVRPRLQRMLFDRHPSVAARVFSDHEPYLAKAWKVPLLRNANGLRIVNDHEINTIPNCKITGCLAHFKFAPDIIDKIERALRRKSYYHQSLEYRILKAAFDTLATEDLVCAESVRFTGKDDLKAAKHLSFSIAPF
jgi:hypothetical protein